MTERPPITRNWHRDGISQSTRLPLPLKPGFVSIDERQPHTLLAQLEQLAAHIPLTDGNGHPSASRWLDFFAADQTFVIAAMMGVDTGSQKARFDQALGGADETLSALCLAFSLAERLEACRRRLALVSGQTAHELERRLSHIVRLRLVQPLASLKAANTRLAAGLQFHAFDGPWLAEHENTYASGWPEPPGLREAFSALLSAMHDIAKAAMPYFDESFKRSDHDPALAVLFAFLGLMGKAQARLNRFTERHRSFYYRDVLGAAPRPGKPRRLMLSLERPVTGEPLHVPAGTEITLDSSDDPEPRIFRSTTELWASDTEVAMLGSECLDKDQKISPEGDLGYVSRIRFGLSPSATTDGASQAWQPFGQPVNQGQLGPEPAENFGFAVAAPALFLAEGERRIDLIVQFAEPSAVVSAGSIDGYVDRLLDQADHISSGGAAYRASDILQIIAGQLFQHMMLTGKLSLRQATREKLIDRINSASSLPGRSAEVYAQLFDADIDSSVFIDRLLSKAFEVSLTGPDGWIVIDDVRVRRLGGDPPMSLRLSVRLSSGAPQVVAYDPEVHGNRLPAKTPVLRCVLSQRAKFCAYSLLDGLELQQITIETEVSGLRGLHVANQEAELDPTKPFFAFGVRPATGSFLSFGGGELALKDLISLKLKLEWKDLPTEAGGFKTHYAGYGGDFANNDFKAARSLLRDGQWRSLGSHDVDLFETADRQGRLSAKSTISFDDLLLWRAAAFQSNAAPAAGFAKDGWFRLTLTAPGEAFGHRRHPTLFAEKLTERLRARKKTTPIPNEPYTPALRSIEIDYETRTVISVDQSRPSKLRPGEALFHMHPLGYVEILPNRRLQQNTFLPHLEFNGSLLIGLQNYRADAPLTLLFHMAEDTHSRRIKEIGAISWRACTRSGWQRLAPERILEDTTQGLMGSGLVTLDLPNDLDDETTSLPAGYVWLKASVDRGLNLFPSLFSVRAQGIEVKEELPGDKRLDDRPLPANGRWQSNAHLPGVTGIEQVGGVLHDTPMESDEQFQKRMSERLRHKMRAVTPWDYERLVLERFPDVMKVKCFSNINPAKVLLPASHREIRPDPGHVLVVVTPKPKPGLIEPCAGLTLDQPRLQTIQDYLQKLAPASARIEVRNPTYDRLQVRCRVRFDKRQVGGAGIHRLQQEIAMYLSPWMRAGYRASFAWTMHPKDVKGHLRALRYVDDVVGLSLLQLIETDSGIFTLHDSARAVGDGAQIRPSYPWSLALPLKRHAIEIAEPDDDDAHMRPAALGDLELGQTFVIDEAR